MPQQSAADSPRPKRPATQEDVARAVGVSRTLVSFAFRGEPGVSPATRDLIFAAANDLGYRTNTVAARLASKRNTTLGLYMLDLRNEVYADIFDGLREVLHETENHLVLSVATSASDTDRGAVDMLLNARVGVIVAATFTESDDEIRRLAQSVPVVNTVRRVEGVDSVYSDDVAGGRMATEFLLTLGHRRVAHVAGPRNEGLEGRRTAYSAVMEEAGLRPQVVTSPDYSQESATRAIAPLLDSGDTPTAIFANNDLAALGVRTALHERGLRIPEDVSLIGYDNTRASRLPGVDLTTIDLHAVQIGRDAGRVALERLADPGSPPVDLSSEPTMVSRGTTAPPRGAL